MKRIVFRLSVLAVVVALGLLAIAHAQRTVPDGPPPDDGSSNPLRNGQPAPAASEAPANSRADLVGPVDTDVPPRRESAPRPPRQERRQCATAIRRRAARSGANADSSPGRGRARRRKCRRPRQHPARFRGRTPAHAGSGRPLCRSGTAFGKPECGAAAASSRAPNTRPAFGPARSQQRVSSRLDPRRPAGRSASRNVVCFFCGRKRHRTTGRQAA